ncbi:MAG: ABC transporter substrate-binding protein [Alphaproteobacteria bacterium]|nr:ABC transporter substrate-binding protein [Alphaproteobacteria bacterium]MDE2352829.1 ABC transporter substrate-binding protein [Alphaproteobacteria bacterium]
MSDVVAFGTRRPARPRLRLGLLRLTDSAPVIAAHEFGFFADEGIEVELSIEPSWANIADKLTYGFLDAAVIVPPLAFAVHLGVRGVSQPLLVPYVLSAGGNTITLCAPLARAVEERKAMGLSTIGALAAVLRAQDTTLGVVHAYSTHNLLLRYWLATAGIDAGSDVRIAVVPPALAAEALASGRIAGFCAGAPWGEVARRSGAGTTVATSHDIWQHAPEKAFAVCARWAEDHPDALMGALRALLRASKFCDDPQNAAYTAALLSRRKYLDVDSHAILASLPGGAPPGTQLDLGSAFYRGAATFPWVSHARWFLDQMRRWDMIEAGADLQGLASAVYRPDLYRAALAPLGEPLPVESSKPEGAHDRAWRVDAVPDSIAMPADRFCDGAVFTSGEAPEAIKPTVSALHNP